MRERLLMTELLYLAPNKRYDLLMRDLAEADENTLAKANAGNLKAMRDLLRLRDVPLLAKFARERLTE
jgi:digeranylgeranylglycerophospholipid reductase